MHRDTEHYSHHELYFEPLEDRRVLSGLSDVWLVASQAVQSNPSLPLAYVPTSMLVSQNSSSGVASQQVSSVSLAVAATAIAPSISISTSAGQTIPNGGAVDFGTAIKNQAEPQFVFIVSNNGTATLNLGSLALPSGFHLVEGLPASLASGTADTFTVALDTSTVATRSGTLSLASNDTSASPYRITLTGKVTADVGPVISIFSSSGVSLPTGALVDFGSVIRGQTSPQRTFFVQNTGTSTLSLGTLSLPAGFRVLEGLPTALAAGAVDSFTIGMDTSTIGTKAGPLQLVNNAALLSPFVLNLRGVVTAAAAPEVTVTNASGLLVANGSVVDLGSVALGAIGTPTVFVVQNRGTSTLSIANLVVPTGFQIVNPLAASLLPGQSDTFSVQLNSSAIGIKSGILSFTTNDPNASVFRLSLSGLVMAIAPEISVTTATGQSIPTGGSLSFGSVLKGSVPPQLAIIVRNDGTGTLTFGSVTIPSGFQAVQGLPASLAPQTSATLVVQLITSYVGSKSGELRIVNNDANENPYRIVLSGQVTAAAPQLVVTNGAQQSLASGSTIDFGKMYIGQTSPSQTVTITNTGTKILTITNVVVPTGFRMVSRPAGSMDPGASQSITLQLMNYPIGVKAGTFSFTTNDPANALYSLTLTGQVLANAPQVQVLTSTLTNLTSTSVVDFGSAIKGGTGPIQTFVIRNVGTQTLTLGPLTLPTGFALVSNLPRTIAAGGSVTFTVQLLTTVVGTKTGLLSLVTNDPLANPFKFTIKGTVK